MGTNTAVLIPPYHNPYPASFDTGARLRSGSTTYSNSWLRTDQGIDRLPRYTKPLQDGEDNLAE